MSVHTTRPCPTRPQRPAGRAAGRSLAPGRGGALRALPTVFIDGEAGTTGLQVRERLAGRRDLRLVSLPEALRKDASARRDALNAADAVLLCLPDEAAVEAVALVESALTVVIDASTAFRTAPGWTYGFAELAPGQRAAIAASKRISNPGCYPTGFLALTRPLLDAGLLPPDARLSVSAVSGYTGGGKALIRVYEEGPHEPWGAYGFNLRHKHLPEMARWSGLTHPPVFCPSVADFAQGMVVQVPLHYSQMSGASAATLAAALRDRYAGEAGVEVLCGAQAEAALERGAFLRADGLAGRDGLQLFVFADDERGTALLVARLDNLGKGASGAAVQNLNLSLGLEERIGLV